MISPQRLKKRSRTLAAQCLAVLACVACTTPPSSQAAGEREGSSQNQPARPRERSGGTGALSPDYRLAPRDTVQIEVFNQPDVHTEGRLTANGELTIKLIGPVALQGLTVREAEERLEKLFKEGGYFVDPQVIVSVEEYSERSINVLGQVHNPSRVAIPPELDSMGILEAITLAGGFTRIARTDRVQVTRRSATGAEEKFNVNVQELLDRRRSETKEFQLQAGDVIFVPERTL